MQTENFSNGWGVSFVGRTLQAWKGRAPTIPFFSSHSKTRGRQAHSSLSPHCPTSSLPRESLATNCISWALSCSYFVQTPPGLALTSDAQSSWSAHSMTSRSWKTNTKLSELFELVSMLGKGGTHGPIRLPLKWPVARIKSGRSRHVQLCRLGTA